MRRLPRTTRLHLALVAVLVLAAAACGVVGGQAAPETARQITPTVPAAADRPTPGGTVTRRCGSHYAEDFDPGVESRTVTAGPVSLVAFRVSPVPSGASPARMFKVMVRLAAGSEATLRTATAGTALLYDRATFRTDNIYRLTDGDRSVRFVGCRDRSAVFNGAILTTGPRTVDLDVLVAGKRIPAKLTAYTS
jgi:hypothetical protein